MKAGEYWETKCKHVLMTGPEIANYITELNAMKDLFVIATQLLRSDEFNGKFDAFIHYKKKPEATK